MSEPRWPLLQQECQRLHCSGEHLFHLTSFWLILRGKKSGSTAMCGHDPVTQGTLQREGSALTFQLIEVHKIPGESSRQLPEIIKCGSSQDSSPAVMLSSS